MTPSREGPATGVGRAVDSAGARETDTRFTRSPADVLELAWQAGVTPREIELCLITHEILLQRTAIPPFPEAPYHPSTAVTTLSRADR